MTYDLLPCRGNSEAAPNGPARLCELGDQGGRSSVQPATNGGRSIRVAWATLSGQGLEFAIRCPLAAMASSTLGSRRSGRSHRAPEEIVCMHFMFQGPQNPLYPMRSLLFPY